MWQTGIMPMSGSAGQTYTVPQFDGPRIMFRKKTRFMKALGKCELGKLLRDMAPESLDTYFRDQTLGHFLPHMDFNPVYNGRPRREVLPLLLTAPTPMKFWQQGLYFAYGLVTYEPVIANRRKARARLSYAGLELLDYWADKYPKFKPFVDAYVPIKARKEIAADAVGYRLGIIPSRFAKMKELHEKEIMKNRDTPNRRKFAQRIEQRRQLILAQQAQFYGGLGNQVGTAMPPQWAQQALQTAAAQAQNLQQYQASLTNAVATSTIPVYPANDTTTVAGSSIGSAIGRLLGRK
jgi:hypothetical protein